jgi:asparagine synthase (glutamine-hydrolysing)
MYTSDPSGDERDYARSVAQHVGARLEEIRFEPDDISLREATAPHLPRPLGKMFKQALRRAHQRIRLSHDIDAIFDGNGGDNVFCYLHSETPVVDRIRDQGILSSWPVTMVEMATITRCDLPRLLRRTAARLPRARRRYAWEADTRFLSADCLETADLTAAHPVLADTKGQLYGKSVHISLLLRMQNHVDPYPAETGLANIHPLLAQPVVETCLSIPTWQWCAGGINRSVARSAYRERLPAHIVRRVSKAGPDSFIFKVYDDQRDDIGVFLRDGVLAGYGIVDLAAIDAELTRSVPREQGHLRLLALCEAEAWARSWCPGARC